MPESPESAERVLELRARPLGVLALAGVIVGACVLAAFAEPDARAWCVLAALGVYFGHPDVAARVAEFLRKCGRAGHS